MRLFSLTYLLPALLALLPACSVSNTNHCGNLEGNATCSQRGAAAPYCSICVADNDGCVSQLPDASCLATTAPATSQTTSEPATQSTTSEPPTSTTSITTPTTTGTGDTTTTSTTDTTAAPTTDLPVTTTGETTTSTGDTSSTSLDTSTSDTSTSDTSTGTTADTDTDTGGTTMIDPLCGNNMIDGDEVCDGTNKNGKDCTNIVANKWGGGMLTCNASCESFNDTKCCIGVGMACNILAPRCCNELVCGLGGTCVVQ